jgi:hypothetical protein
LSVCYTIILWFYTRFNHLRIMRIWCSNPLSFSLILLDRVSFSPVVREITRVKKLLKGIILETNWECGKSYCHIFYIICIYHFHFIAALRNRKEFALEMGNLLTFYCLLIVHRQEEVTQKHRTVTTLQALSVMSTLKQCRYKIATLFWRWNDVVYLLVRCL